MWEIISFRHVSGGQMNSIILRPLKAHVTKYCALILRNVLQALVFLAFIVRIIKAE